MRYLILCIVLCTVTGVLSAPKKIRKDTEEFSILTGQSKPKRGEIKLLRTC